MAYIHSPEWLGERISEKMKKTFWGITSPFCEALKDLQQLIISEGAVEATGGEKVVHKATQS